MIPFEPGRSAWDATSNGITLKLSIDPPQPRVGDTVRFGIEASSVDQPCCGVYLLYGDGGSSSWKMEWPGKGCDVSDARSSAASYSHSYNREGRWEFSFQAATGGCGSGNVYGALHGYIQVAPGAARAQGPAVPTIEALEARAPNEPVRPGFLKAWARGEDNDGYISRFVVDFGDGSSVETRPGDPMGCRPTPAGWPARSMASLQEPYPSHQYAEPGTYTVTVTVTSTGCDGGEAQTATATFPYVW